MTSHVCPTRIAEFVVLYLGVGVARAGWSAYSPSRGRCSENRFLLCRRLMALSSQGIFGPATSNPSRVLRASTMDFGSSRQRAGRQRIQRIAARRGPLGGIHRVAPEVSVGNDREIALRPGELPHLAADLVHAGLRFGWTGSQRPVLCRRGDRQRRVRRRHSRRRHRYRRRADRRQANETLPGATAPPPATTASRPPIGQAEKRRPPVGRKEAARAFGPARLPNRRAKPPKPKSRGSTWFGFVCLAAMVNTLNTLASPSSKQGSNLIKCIEWALSPLGGR